MTAGTVVKFIVLVLATPAVMFLTAGTMDWWQGWVVAMVTVVLQLGGRALLLRVHPDLAAERAAAGRAESRGVPSWDRVLMPFVALVGPYVSLIVAGLDRRWGWSGPVAPGLWIACLIVYVLGSLWSTWAMLSNRFFLANVRIQTERHQTVYDRGPYSIVRHPGYAGSVVGGLACIIVLGSWWALIPAGLTNMAIVLRTALEDGFLRRELAGYQAYAQKVRYRLLPGVW